MNLAKILFKLLKVSLDSDFSKIDSINNIKLEENDLVVVREKLGYQDKEFVTVEGLVKFPGTYAIKNNNYSVYDLIQDFGGFLQDASLDGVKIVRENKLDDIIKEEEEEKKKKKKTLLNYLDYQIKIH